MFWSYPYPNARIKSAAARANVKCPWDLGQHFLHTSVHGTLDQHFLHTLPVSSIDHLTAGEQGTGGSGPAPS